MRKVLMRQPPLEAEDMADKPLPTSQCGGSHDCVWRPSSKSNDFEANAAIVLILLLCALICALALNTGIRCFLRRGERSSGGQQRQPLDEPREAQVAAAGAAPVAYSLEIKPKLAGTAAEAECAICLSEFMEGERIRILEECSHGFHVECIHKWLCSNSSCPTCRHSCNSSSLSSSKVTTESCHGGGAHSTINPEARI